MRREPHASLLPEVQDPAGDAKRDADHDENGKPATEGKCPVCGTKMFKIGKAATA
jgi:hypothetical protein